MPKNIVICLDGTNNKIQAAVNTNVVRMFDLLDLSNPAVQVGYYDPGVGTSASPSAWTPVARTVSRYAGLAFGAGLRQNLGEAYTYLMSVFEAGDRVFVFGFSRGAYTARALTGMLEVFGLFRHGSENLVPYAVSEYAKQERGKRDFGTARQYARIHGREIGGEYKDHFPIHFVGLWDTVKAAGPLWRQLKWPYTRQLPHASTIRHAVSIDEKRRAYREYLVERPKADHRARADQDLEEVWFAGVHSDVGGLFPTGARLSDIPLKWMAEQAVAAGLCVRPQMWDQVQQVTDNEATGRVHRMGAAWVVLGTRRREIPNTALLHSSVASRIAEDPSYGDRLPHGCTFVDGDWQTAHPLLPVDCGAVVP